jgi:8-amino-7-oxononanoate synthase
MSRETSPGPGPLAAWKARVDALAAAGLERTMRRVSGPAGPIVATPDGDKLLFCSNNYLGLAADPRLVRAMTEAARDLGAGVCSSRLVSGNGDLHDAVERRAAALLGAEAAVAFTSGFQANLGAITSLVEAGDAVFSDALNHASIVDGCRLSRAEIGAYRHADAAHLEQLLAESRAPGVKLVITEAVFSMDGDEAPLRAICSAARRHGAAVYVDEAHALGVLGPGGRGLTAELGLEAEVAVRMGTFGKALGVAGAFVACGEIPARLLRSRARSLLYTTAQPLPLAAAILVSLDLVEAADERREALRRNVRAFRELARAAGVVLAESKTPIQPVPVGSAHRVTAVSDALWRRGVFLQGIRPPTVAEGTARLRVTLTAEHTEAQIAQLVDALAASLEETAGTP